MTIVNHEYYVSLEVSKLLKEAGFDWDTYSAYNKDGVFADKNRSITTWNDFENYYSAPTIDVAQRWLREVRGYDVFVVPCNGLYFYTVRKYYHEDKVDYFDYPNKDAFDTYEKTLETGIQKALEIMLEKGV